MSGGAVSSKTTGFVIYGEELEAYAGLRGGSVTWYNADVHVYPSVPELLKVLANGFNDSLGRINIHKQIEQTTITTATKRVPLE